MEWEVFLLEEFAAEAADYSDEVREELAFKIGLLKKYGPKLSRPHADTLDDSDYANMKELRFDADNGVWRIAFAFDPKRKAILLVGGDKSGTSKNKFYNALIAKADKRYAAHLKELKDLENSKGKKRK